MKVHLHQTHHQIADFTEIFNYIKTNISNKTPGLHLFPETFLTGYPLQDLCLQKPFVNSYLEMLKELKKWLAKNIISKDVSLLIGGLEYELSDSGIPIRIHNIVFLNDEKHLLENIYTKQLLPNYDIFDEKKYYTRGKENVVIETQGKKFGILICEDMWASSFHEIDPVKALAKKVKKEKIDIDGVINLSASPYNIGKFKKRFSRATYISNLFKAPFFYINKVGGEDEVLFDGGSFIQNSDKTVENAPFFKDIILTVDLPEKTKYQTIKSGPLDLSWESLFDSRLNHDHTPPKMEDLSDEMAKEVLEALKFGVQEYATKSGFNKFTIALSGGMDSALVLTILRLSLKDGQSLEAIYMPSIYSSSQSYDLSLQLCQNLGVPLKTLPIKFLHSATKNLFSQSYSDEFAGLTDENVQSRIRGMLLYTRSNQIGSMVINTSNKSELAVGYSTQYGDSVGAISMLGDLYKTEVYQLAKYLNKNFNNIIPNDIITREPTAELREGQTDNQSLPPYEVLDGILEGILNYRYTRSDLMKAGFSKEDVEKTLHLYRRNEYKRYQFCPIIKLSTKSFGFGYRIPINKESSFYLK